MEKAAVKEKKTGAVSLFPLFVFFALYLGVSLCAGDFYKMPITVAFLAGAAVSIAMYRGVPLGKRIKRFSEGASHSNIMLMVWIFVLAGAVIVQVVAFFEPVDKQVVQWTVHDELQRTE